jgi:hypothetical protein
MLRDLIATPEDTGQSCRRVLQKLSLLTEESHQVRTAPTGTFHDVADLSENERQHQTEQRGGRCATDSREGRYPVGDSTGAGTEQRFDERATHSSSPDAGASELFLGDSIRP